MGSKPQKIKWRINFFDIVIILAALCAAIIIYKINAGGNSIVTSSSQQTVRYTVELVGMVEDTAYGIKPGDALTDKVERRAMGHVSEVAVTPYRPSVRNNDTGDYVIAEYPFDEKKTAIVTIVAEAAVSDSEISIGGYIVRVGTEVSVMGPLYAGSGYIIDIDRD